MIQFVADLLTVAGLVMAYISGAVLLSVAGTAAWMRWKNR